MSCIKGQSFNGPSPDCDDWKKLTRWNVGGLPLSSPHHPPYIDPLYAPYYRRSQGWGPDISPYKKIPPYPVIDGHPDRMRLGWGVRFRSQQDGITMPDFVMGPNQIGYPKPPETYGPFYTNDIYKRFPTVGLYYGDYPRKVILDDGTVSVVQDAEEYQNVLACQCRDPRAF